MLCMKFVAKQTLLGETSQPLQHRFRQHCRSCCNENDSEVFKHIIVLRQNHIKLSHALLTPHRMKYYLLPNANLVAFIQRHEISQINVSSQIFLQKTINKTQTCCQTFMSRFSFLTLLLASYDSISCVRHISLSTYCMHFYIKFLYIISICLFICIFQCWWCYN